MNDTEEESTQRGKKKGADEKKTEKVQKIYDVAHKL